MSEPLVTIVCVPREVFSTTERSLETLYTRTSSPFELIYIDGGSPPPIRHYLEKAAERYNFTLLRSEQLLTPNQARNLALEYITTPYVVFVDNDVLVGKNWLTPLLECALETGAWAVGPLYFEHMPEQHRLHMVGGQCQILDDENGNKYYIEDHLYGHKLLSEIKTPIVRHETELFEFHTVLLSMAVFERFGPLDEGLLSLYEHADLSLQIRAAGECIVIEPRSSITYVPPKRLYSKDRRFFELRWSESWNLSSIEHFFNKRHLQDSQQARSEILYWVRTHRLYGNRTLTVLRRLFGSEMAFRARRFLVGRIEKHWNRLKYPRRKYGAASSFSKRLVHERDLNARSAS